MATGGASKLPPNLSFATQKTAFFFHYYFRGCSITWWCQIVDTWTSQSSYAKKFRRKVFLGIKDKYFLCYIIYLIWEILFYHWYSLQHKSNQDFLLQIQRLLYIHRVSHQTDTQYQTVKFKFFIGSQNYISDDFWNLMILVMEKMKFRIWTFLDKREFWFCNNFFKCQAI